MRSTQRILPYTKQLVLYALYDVLDSEESEYDRAENGSIAARITVYGNKSGFVLSVCETPPATSLMVEVSEPCAGLSRQGEQRAVDYLADRVEQLLENELELAALIQSKKEKHPTES